MGEVYFLIMIYKDFFWRLMPFQLCFDWRFGFCNQLSLRIDRTSIFKINAGSAGCRKVEFWSIRTIIASMIERRTSLSGTQ